MILRSGRCLDVGSGISRGREQKDGWSSGPRMRLGPGQQRYLFGWARWQGVGLIRYQRTSVKCIWGNNSRWLGVWGMSIGAMTFAASREELNLSKNEFSILSVWYYDSISGSASWTVNGQWESRALLGGDCAGSRLANNISIVDCESWLGWLRVCVCVHPCVCVNA